jgi:hypothetical protein
MIPIIGIKIWMILGARYGYLLVLKKELKIHPILCDVFGRNLIRFSY